VLLTVLFFLKMDRIAVLNKLFCFVSDTLAAQHILSRVSSVLRPPDRDLSETTLSRLL
jgi:hypothetical protein